MINWDDYKTDGRTNWQALNAARIAAGEICQRCERFILFTKGHAALCDDCQRVDNEQGKVTHHGMLRCPKCRASFEVDSEMAGCHIYGDGEHDVHCRECEHKFTVQTHVSYSFESPALLPE